MEMNELFMCSAANADADEMLLPSLLPPPLLHFESSSSSSSPWPPSCLLDTRLDLDSVLGSLSSLSTTATENNESWIIGQLFSGNVLTPRSSRFNHHRQSLSTDPGFADRAEKFSCLDRRNPPLGKYVSTPAGVPATTRLGNCDSPNCRDESSRSLEGSSISEKVTRKRKSLDRGKAKEPSKFAEEGDDSVITTTKRSKEDEEVGGGDDVGPAKLPKLGNEAEGEGRGGGRTKKNSKKGEGGDDVEPPKDYIHVRARRGQATDSHSLAERARREKISERMKMLQDLVPSCSKVTGKALMLDEIINYVQSLQRQVEFLSMKLASVNTNMHYAMNTRIISKDTFQSSNSDTITAAQLSMFEPPIHEKMQEGTNFKYSVDPPLPDSRIPPLNGLDDQILAPFRGEDLQSIVEMGLFGQMNPRDFNGQGQMNNSMNIMEELQQ